MSPLLNSNSASDIAAQRVDLVDVAKLCEYLNCSAGDLFETVR